MHEILEIREIREIREPNGHQLTPGLVDKRCSSTGSTMRPVVGIATRPGAMP
ncbi:hypothetical protein OG754_01885 [Streptomyces decoyicus]|uniref:hypothetical protein n=1 Tax=Streptomyces decoyicus TaxID=249567 RepID=UPI002E347588|nr:hypothetical protein [Streptomyces decoyicus]